MMTCVICNLAMEVGDGKPMFTAECSHCFHFLCVVSNAKSGNQNCVTNVLGKQHALSALNSLATGSYSMRLTDMNQTGFIDVGDLYENEERDFLVLLNVLTVGDEDSSTATKLVHVGCIYKDPFSKQIKSTAVKKVKIQRPETEEEGFVVVSVEVDRQKCKLRATKAMSDSRDAAERGDLSGAWSILKSCQKELSETTSAPAGNQLCALCSIRFRAQRDTIKNAEQANI